MTTMMKKTGRQRSLTPAEEADLRQRIALFHQVRKECSPAALARRYNLAPSTVREYAAQNHKRAPGESAASFCPLVPGALAQLLTPADEPIVDTRARDAA